LFDEGNKRLTKKIVYINGHPFPLTEFGTRRRYSFDWQDHVIGRLVAEVPTLTGTSNVYFAKKYGIKALGTQAHEYVCQYQGFDTNTVAMSQRVAFETWLNFWDGDLGIALTDTLGHERFLYDFGKKYANAFTGVRHDSGDPFVWGDSLIDHYNSLGIDPKTKTLMFSDSLDFEKAWALYCYFKDRAKLGFGIGTYCTNDMSVKPLNLVMKLVRIGNRPVAKLSNVNGKEFSDDPEYTKYLKQAILIR
jgi:nicotinate phosphoribosyltransferase